MGTSSWMTPIIEYLTNEVLSIDEKETKRIRRQAAYYVMSNGEFFRRGFSTSLLKCLDDDQVEFVLAKLYRGICGMHSGAAYGDKGTSGWILLAHNSARCPFIHPETLKISEVWTSPYFSC